jgi:hypothetical protein
LITADHVLREASKAGLTLRLSGSGGINAAPAALITPSIRQLIKVNKAVMMMALDSARPELTSPIAEVNLERQLLAAAMRVCDYWGDSDQARAEMVADIKATSQHLRQDLLEHLLVAFGKSK